MLELYLKERPDEYADAIGATCLVRRSGEALGAQEAQFSNCPVEFLRKFIGLRRKGQVSFQHTWDKCYTHVNSMKQTLVSHYALFDLHSLNINESSMIRGRLCPCLLSECFFLLSPTENVLVDQLPDSQKLIPTQLNHRFESNPT